MTEKPTYEELEGRLKESAAQLAKADEQLQLEIIKHKQPEEALQRMDGSGYPQGLSGEDILSEARILGVADVVEAMASHRPYRAALGIDKALEEISINRGKLYDNVEDEKVDHMAVMRMIEQKGLPCAVDLKMI